MTEHYRKKCVIPHDHGHGTEKLLESMPSDRAFEESADIFGQLSDATRLRILWILCHSEECVNDIAAAIDMSAPAVSHHLRNLKQSGFIRSRRDGKEVLYRLEDTATACLVHKMVDGVFQMRCPRADEAGWERVEDEPGEGRGVDGEIRYLEEE